MMCCQRGTLSSAVNVLCVAGDLRGLGTTAWAEWSRYQTVRSPQLASQAQPSLLHMALS